MLARLDNRRAGALRREVEAFLSQRTRANKKLARDVAAWVDEAMHAAERQRGLGGVGEAKEAVSEEDSRVSGGFSWFF